MTHPTEAILDKAVAQARAMQLDPAVIQARADECVRWTAGTPRTSPFAWLRVRGFALALAAVVLALIVREARHAPSDVRAAAPITAIGPRVAIAASPDAVYTVVAATATQTELAVRAGAVTARLYPGATPHRLRMTAGSLEAIATGTIYSLVVPASGAPYAVVHEGHVEVHERDAVHPVSAGQSWPVMPIRPDIDARAQRLASHVLAPIVAAQDPVAGSASTPASDLSSQPASDDTPGLDAGAASAERPSPSPASVEQRWQRARQLRGQGHPREALEILEELGKRADAVWSPIAIAEAMRIRASEPRAVIQLGQDLLARYPAHPLVREVTDMMCRAHRALGEAELPSACLLHGIE